MVNALRRGVVLAAQQGDQRAQRLLQWGAEPFALDVLLQLPEITRWRQAVANVQRAFIVAQRGAKAAFVAEDHVLVAQHQPGPGQRVERQKGLVVSLNAGQTVQPKRANVRRAQGWRHALWRINAGVDRAVRPELQQRFQHILRAANLVEPVVHQRQLHGTSPPVSARSGR